MKNGDLVMTENHLEGDTLVKVNRKGPRADTGREKEVAATKRGNIEMPKGALQLPTSMAMDSKVFSF